VEDLSISREVARLRRENQELYSKLIENTEEIKEILERTNRNIQQLLLEVQGLSRKIDKLLEEKSKGKRRWIWR